MKIERLTMFRQWQPFASGSYVCSGGRSADGFDSTIIRIEGEDGAAGWGEMAPLGSFYDPAFAAAAREGVKELAPKLVGLDAREPVRIGRLMDHALKGHPYVKSPLDMALWDLEARAAGLPSAQALGGRFTERVPLYRSVSQGPADDMARQARRFADQGYRRLQVKVGLEVGEDIERLEAVIAAVPKDTVIFADANGSWSTFEARRFLAATARLDYTLEQPCASYAENKSLRSACQRPFVLDESIDSLAALLTASADGIVDGITIKISRLGGVGKAKLVRDVAVELGLRVTIEDTGGAHIDTAAIAHLMASTPQENQQHTVDFHNWVTAGNALTPIECQGGMMRVPDGAGLGIEVDAAALGKPVWSTDRCQVARGYQRAKRWAPAAPFITRLAKFCSIAGAGDHEFV